MNWYYAENNQQKGPVGEEDFEQFASNGTIKPETLVWHEGMANWTPYSSIPQKPAPSAAVPGTGQARCAECGQVFPEDSVVIIEGQPVCASCKPIALHKLKEGVQMSGEMVYAGFWIRFGAKFIDGIILQILVRSLAFLVGLALGATGNNDSTFVAVAGGAVGLLVGATYAIWFNGKYGATPGKMACKLRIIRPDGSPITYGRACGRYFAEMLSSITLGIGYIMVAFDEEKRSLHDRICDTRVIRKP